MIFENTKEQVIRNICDAAERGNFHVKVEVDDPQLTDSEKNSLVSRYLIERRSASYRRKNFLARQIANVATWYFNRDTKIIGLENSSMIKSGAIITANHFSPIDNTIIRRFVRKAKKKYLPVVSQESNLAMPGIVGFLMNYADTLPITSNRYYMQHNFEKLLSEELEKNQFVLIYPEQEMWFRYRKPRPCKRGAYYYAAKMNVPIIPCFVEMREKSSRNNEVFKKLKFTLHILPAIYPDPNQSVRENSIRMCKMDYIAKSHVYEVIYGKKLDYHFETDDIAGWTGQF